MRARHVARPALPGRAARRGQAGALHGGGHFRCHRRYCARIADATGAGSARSSARANHRSLFVPKGLAHGFITLRDDTEVYYMISVPYAPALSRGFRWNDPAFGIEWPMATAVDFGARRRLSAARGLQRTCAQARARDRSGRLHRPLQPRAAARGGLRSHAPSCRAPGPARSPARRAARYRRRHADLNDPAVSMRSSRR